MTDKSESNKQGLGAKRIAGILLAAIFVSVLAVSNLDAVGKSWYQEGSLLPSIICFEVFTSIESALGVRSLRLADAWSELAHAYSKVPRYKDAIRAEYQAIDLKSELVGETDPSTMILKAHVGEYLARDGKYTEADSYLMDALRQIEKNVPVEPISKAYVLEAMAQSFIAQKKWDAAIEVARQILPTDDQLLREGRSCFDARELLAEIYARAGRQAEALAIGRQSLELKQKHLPANKIGLAMAHETLGKALIADKQTTAASEEFKKAIELLQKEYGTSGERMLYWRSRYDHLLHQNDPYAE